jgi:hypothetical protein
MPGGALSTINSSTNESGIVTIFAAGSLVYCRINVNHIKKRIDIISREKIMSIDRLVMAFAGAFIIVSLLLAWAHSIYWLLFTGFVGLNMFQASLTGFCPLAIILKKMGIPSGVAFK